MPTHVLFVCLGNICRSPMAEYILRDMVSKAGLEQVIQVASAGTSGWHNGEDMHAETKTVLQEHAIDCSGFHSQQVQHSDVDYYNPIIVMDDNNLQALKKIFTCCPSQQVYKITDLLPDSPLNHVPDPYFTGNFQQTYQIIHAGCLAWLKQWQNTHHSMAAPWQPN